MTRAGNIENLDEVMDELTEELIEDRDIDFANEPKKDLDLGYPSEFVDAYIEKYLPRYVLADDPRYDPENPRKDLREEPDTAYALLIKLALMPPRERNLEKMPQKLGYSLRTLRKYADWFQWIPRLKAYDLAMEKQRLVHRSQSIRQYQDDVTSHLLGDYSMMREAWLEEFSKLQYEKTLDALQIKRLIESRKMMDDLARRSVNLPSTISASVSDQVNDENPDDYAYDLTPDGNLKKIKVEKPDKAGLE